MTQFSALVIRNTKLFFKDKGMFFTSLITPLILLLLYVTFLGNVYRDAFIQTMPVTINNELLNGLVGGQLVSSLLAVCCVTVAFCSNMLMVQDKFTGALKDIQVSPVKGHILALSYYVSTVAVTFLICSLAFLAGIVYLCFTGFYLSAADILTILFLMLLLILFATGLSSIINTFLSTQGQVSAVGSIISSVYGFLCGAYMPISNFPKGLQNTLAFLPGTYGTSLLRNASMRGVLYKLKEMGFDESVITAMKNGTDCNIYCFGNLVELKIMYLVLILTVMLITGIYILMNIVKFRRKDT